MKRLFAYLLLPPQVLLLLYRIYRNPKDNTVIFKVSAFRDHSAWQHAIEHSRSDPSVAKLMQERYVAGKLHDLEALDRLPAGTLGREYARHKFENQFRPDFYPIIPPDSDLNYLRQRANESHDIRHVVTGIPVDEAGELKLLAVDLAQSHWPLAGMIIGVSFLVTTLKYPNRLGELGDGIAEGWRLGKKMKPLMAYKWEEMWNLPLSGIQRELGVKEAG